MDCPRCQEELQIDIDAAKDLETTESVLSVMFPFDCQNCEDIVIEGRFASTRDNGIAIPKCDNCDEQPTVQYDKSEIVDEIEHIVRVVFICKCERLRIEDDFKLEDARLQRMIHADIDQYVPTEFMPVAQLKEHIV